MSTDEIAARLARLVADVLERPTVAPDQDVFALGADSLQAIELLARVQDEWGVEVSLEELFAAPTAAALAAVVERARAADRVGSATEPASDPAAIPLTRRPRQEPEERLPLSFAQRRLWFLHQLEPNNPVHNLGAAVRLQGRLDVPALDAALREIVRRHEVLRTGYLAAGAEPAQVVMPARFAAETAPTLPYIDLAALPAAVREGEARALGRCLGRRSFDLERGDVLRFALLRAASEEHELCLAFHHIAADGGALAVLADELAALYGAFAAGRRSPLAEPPVQYADYALWQRRRTTEAALAPGLAYWRQRLAGELPVLDLPADRPRPAVQSHRGAHYERRLGDGVAAALERLARQQRATPFMVLLAGFAALVGRYSGQTDLLLGTPAAGRGRVELGELIGLFLDNLVLRIDLRAEPGLTRLVPRVRDTVLGAFAHQDVPFERLVDELRPARDLSRPPLFQVMFVGQNAPLAPRPLAGLHMAAREIDLGTARFDLAVSMAPVAGGWTATWKLATDLFDVATVARMASHYENLLAAALAAPDLALERLPMVSAAERHQVLAEWSDTGAAWPLEATLHQRIAEQAARRPDAVAVEHGDERLTYGELLRSAAALADRLRALGVGARSPAGMAAGAESPAGTGAGVEPRVGVAAERSIAMVVGLFGTLLAGAAYVPLDPDYPAERLAYMLADADLDAVLVQPHLRSRLADLPARLADGRVLDLVVGAVEPSDPATSGTLPRLSADSPAYAIYTSGSTGRPKGAVVSHRGIVNRLLWMQDAYRLAPGDRVLQKTPFSFDVSVWEFFWPLLTGARLVMAPPGAHQDPARLAALIEERRITTLHFVPSMLQVFLEQPGLAAACRSVRQLFTSGEALPFDLAERCRALLPESALHNLYGPTEASVDVTHHTWRGGGGRQTVPIGRPIANTSILLLDRHLAAVPVGVPGELHIGGVGLARGYLGRPDLTAERFVPDPRAGVGDGAPHGARLYRTGDLARFRPDGEVEFLGRLDHQVKVRGVRIELGEIEAALVRHPRVREAVVLARRDAPPAASAASATSAAMPPATAGAAGVRLVAYVVPAGAAPEPHELRAFLRRGLPEAMVPPAFVLLPALPLTASGKVDRRALPPPAEETRDESAAAAAAFEPPATPLERRLAAFWQEVLGLGGQGRIGRHDSFFELGGDSIQGAMLVNRVQRELGQIVYVMALFDAPTLAGFAAYLVDNYPAAAARLAGADLSLRAEAHDLSTFTSTSTSTSATPLASPAAVAAALVEMRGAVARRLGRAAGPAGADEALPRNPPAVFLLSPFRSGSTLLRVMLAGHSRLFAPPELELLAFADLGERRRVYAGRNAFAREGLLRAVMDLRACDAEEAERLVGAAESERQPVAAWYRRMQEWAGGRLLVDKTPSYALDAATLARAEQLFDRPLYVHLVRHPVATAESYVEARMDRVYSELPYAADVQAQLVWLLAHDNILRFLEGVPAERQQRLAFEDLLREPRRRMEELGRFLGVGFEAGMLEPYAGRRMTDGPRAASRMMGDPKFHQHQGIDAAVADRSRLTAEAAATLAAPLRELAARLGYDLAPRTPAAAAAVPLAAAEPPAAAPPLAAPPSPAAEALVLRPVARGGDGTLPLSYSQERLWFLSQLDPHSAAYNMPAVVRLRGRLDVAALGRSFAAVRRRHEVLRTLFPAEHGRPAPVVLPPESFADAASRLPVVDLAGLSAAARDAEWRRLALAEGRRPFDLARGPMLRTLLLACGAAEHLLLVTLHHIVSDGWTVGVLMRELSALYRAFLAASQAAPSLESAVLPPLPLQYADYAWHQRRWLEGEAMTAHLAYWRRRLAGQLPPLELPTDRPRPAVQTLHGARLSRTLPAAAATEIRAWSGAAGATFFLTLLAAWNALLVRYTGQEDLLLGIPIANRNRLEVEGLIGLFLNMVVQRTAAAGDPTFQDLLAGVREGFLASIPHQEVPFEKLVEDLKPRRDLSRAPIFQVQLSLQNTPGEPLALPGLDAELLEVHNRTTKFDLTVFLFDLPGGLTTTLEYNADLFDAATMARLLGHWETLLSGVVAAADLHLSDLPLLTAAERRQLLTVWNPAPASAPASAPRPAGSPGAPEPLLHELFAAQVERHPNAVAVVHDVSEVTYRQLATRARRLAHRLRALGVGPEVRVGLCVERSIDMPAAILGILEAGGTYVPIDPAYPPERLAWILGDALRDCTPAVLVTERHLLERMENLGDKAPAWRHVLLDEALAAPPPPPHSHPPAPLPPLPALPGLPGAGAASAAYVIYTSGSTGRPKGVAVPHAQVVRLFSATEPWFAFGPDDVWTVFHSYAFDFSVWEIWGALLHGGRLVVVPHEVSLSPPAFYDLLLTEGVTVLNQTPSVFRQLVQVNEEERGRLCRAGSRALRTVIFGGEALDVAALAPWIARHGDDAPALVNMYGITETTVHVTYRRVRAADLAAHGASPIGEPIPDLQVHLLGRQLELLPPGLPGEIHVGGAGLARGYLGRPELTAQRFIPDPFAAAPGGRLYRSGDLARRRPDGDLDYLGRIDSQVKIRGFRIELGEIESALGRHPAVSEAVVAARPGPGGYPRLLAWVIPAGAPAAVSAAELRQHLLRSLPEYMVPAVFVQLAELPLTRHGKVDRRALPEPEEATAGAAKAVPRRRSEVQLAAIWRDILHLEEVGLDGNFFELGGHSLLVAQLASRVRAQLGVELPLRLVFEAPTLGALAARLDPLLAAGGADPAEDRIPRLPRGGPLLPSFAQERLWFLDRLEPESRAYHIAIALRLAGALDVAVFGAALRFLVCRHEGLRTRFVTVDGLPRQWIDGDLALDLPVVDLRSLPAADPAAREAAAGECLAAARRRPFDLERGPLLRVLLVRLAAGEWQALFELHHIVSDGWSNDVLVRELGIAYAALAARRAPHLAELPIQYADFAAWQRQRVTAADPALAAQTAWWRQRLAGAPPVLDLPRDRPRPAVQRYRGRVLRRRLDGELTAALADLCRGEGATLFMALLAGFGALLGHRAGSADLVVGTPVAGRDRLELEGLVGLFVNSLPLRVDLGGEPSFRQLLARCRDMALGAFANQELPFDKLVEELAPARNLGHAPIFQVMLALQNPGGGGFSLPELEVTEMPLPGTTAQLDLTFNAQEKDSELHVRWVYDSDLFDDATVARLADDLPRLLAAAAAEPDLPLAGLPLLADLPLRAAASGAEAIPRPPDRAAVATPSAAHTAPRTRTEARIAAIWRQVLDREEIGVEEDFFALGGHSLLATQVLSRIAAALGVTLPVRALFEAPTVAGLAAAVDGAGARPDEDEDEPVAANVPPLVPRARPVEVPLSYAQERLWFVDQLEGGAYSMPAAVRLRGALHVAALAASLQAIVRRHETLRTRFPAIGGRPVQAIDPWHRGLVPLAVVDLAGLPLAAGSAGSVAGAVDAEIARLARQDEERPFDLARGPLLRCTLLRRRADDFVLLLNMHHLVSDGWSLAVLRQELAALYRACLGGVPPTRSELPDLKVQYADFALWQRAWLSGEALARQLAYWTTELAGLPPLALPVDRPDQAGRMAAAGEVGLVVDVELTAALQGVARRAGASLFMVLLAAFHALLHRLTGGDDIAVGTPTANREWAVLEGLIGFFVNTLVLRGRTGGNPPFLQLLRQVRATTLAAYDHPDVPFARLVEALRAGRKDLGDRADRGQTLFDVIFTLQNQPTSTVELPGVRLEVEQRPGRELAISGDLTLRLWEIEGRLVGGLGYSAARLDRATAARWCGHWRSLLAALAASPETPIDGLPLLAESERHQVSLEWSGDLLAVLAGEAVAPIGVWGELARLLPDGSHEKTGQRARRTAIGRLELAADVPMAAGTADAAAADPEQAAEEIHQGVVQRRAELSGRRDQLPAARRELLERRLRKLAAAGGAARAPKKES